MQTEEKCIFMFKNMKKRNAGKNRYYSISKKLRREGKSSEEFEILFNSLSLEEVIGLKLELASKLEDAPWPATKDELIDFAIRSGAPLEVVENLQELSIEAEIYESIEEIWPDYPTKDDFFFNEDEY